MKEIIRIHLAKIAYNIEIDAKRSLEVYLKTITDYTDQEVANDIELRMTELLDERGVKPDGTITSDDIKAMKTQLGQPEAFVDEVDETKVIEGKTTHRLYRDTQSAVLGGVAKGIAGFFGVSVIWIRIIMIILAFASFGTALLVYGVLWIVIPPVRTAADKLQLEGRPVTIATIHELTESEGMVDSSRDEKTVRIITTLAGLVSSGVALAALAFTVAMAGGAIFIRQGFWHSQAPSIPAWLNPFEFGLLVVSGLLLVTLFTLIAYGLFAQKLTKRLLISGVAIIILGLASFGVGVSMLGIGVNQLQQSYIQHIKTTPIHTEGNLSGIKEFNFDTNQISVNYVVTNKAPHATMSQVSFGQSDIYTPIIYVKDNVATIEVPDSQAGYSYNNQKLITIYGPALDIATVTSGQIMYETATQDSLTANLTNSGGFTIGSGQIIVLTSTLQMDANLNASAASVDTVKLDVSGRASVQLAVVKNMTLTTRQSCASGDQTNITVDKVTGNEVNLNGKVVAAHTDLTACNLLTVNE